MITLFIFNTKVMSTTKNYITFTAQVASIGSHGNNSNVTYYEFK